MDNEQIAQMSPREKRLKILKIVVAVVLVAFSWVIVGVVVGAPAGAVPFC